jgi:hypothetical protein
MAGEGSPKVNWGQSAISIIASIAMFICTVVLFKHSESIASNKEKALVNYGEIEHVKSLVLSPRELRDLTTSIALLERTVADLVEKVQTNR